MIEYGDTFLKEAKQLSKKFKLLKADLKCAIEEIETKTEKESISNQELINILNVYMDHQ